MRPTRLGLSIVALSLLALIAPVLSHPVTARQATPAVACPVTDEVANEATARRWHEELINAGDLDLLDEIAAPDIVHHAGTFPDGVGTDAVKSVIDALISGFPDVHHTIDQVIVDGDMVVIRWHAQGTHNGEFQGHAPTGQQVIWTGISIFRVECGRIAEEWSEVDGLGRLRQLGVLATPAAG